MAGVSDTVVSIGAYQQDVSNVLADWDRDKGIERLWQKDATLWTGADEDRWLGWLDSVAWMTTQVGEHQSFAASVRDDGITDVLLLGMGGSSLCPEVLAMSFGQQAGWPKLHVLDSTVPEQVARFHAAVNLKKTVCVVASKSGTTTEPNMFCDYFWAHMQAAVGKAAGQHFVAITDPGSALEDLARSRNFRGIFLGKPDIGGRFSALSPFGLVPAALMGLDVEAFLQQAQKMVAQCQLQASDNPGAILGTVLGRLAQQGRDKVTLVTSAQIWDLGAWLEQLIAESTGKSGVGLVPVDQESLTDPDVYGDDRVFVYVRLEGDHEYDEKVDALKDQPVVHIEVPSVMDLGAEFYRWEIATAVAGAVLGIHPFNQPNVQESKDFTAKLTQAYEQTGTLPAQTAILAGDGIAAFADAQNQAVFARADTVSNCLLTHLKRLQPGDYLALCAYLDMRPEVVTALQQFRHEIRDRFQVATTLGFGPRFLHSTGQLHKGGADNVVVIQLTAEDAQDLYIPGRTFTFGILKDAQALGDAQALSLQNRRALRLHLKGDWVAGIKKLIRMLE